MFKLFKKKEQKDPVCGMVMRLDFIAKYGEQFCSEKCVLAYEKMHNIDKDKKLPSCCK